MVKIILIKSPDEWATTKQVCRDELVFTSLYSYVLSTVLRKSKFTLFHFFFNLCLQFCSIKSCTSYLKNIPEKFETCFPRNT